MKLKDIKAGEYVHWNPNSRRSYIDPGQYNSGYIVVCDDNDKPILDWQEIRGWGVSAETEVTVNGQTLISPYNRTGFNHRTGPHQKVLIYKYDDTLAEEYRHRFYLVSIGKLLSDQDYRTLAREREEQEQRQEEWRNEAREIRRKKAEALAVLMVKPKSDTSLKFGDDDDDDPMTPGQPFLFDDLDEWVEEGDYRIEDAVNAMLFAMNQMRNLAGAE